MQGRSAPATVWRCRRRHVAGIAVMLCWAVAATASTSSIGASAVFGGSITVPSNVFGTASRFCTNAPAGARLLTGFETGRVFSSSGGTLFTSGNNTGNITADSTVSRNGSYSAKVVANGTSTNAQWFQPVATTVSAVRFAVRLASLPGADVELFRIGSSTGAGLQLLYHTTTQKLAAQFTTGSAAEASATISAGAWAMIDMKIDMTSSTWAGSWKVDNVTQTNVTTSGTAGTNIYGLAIGTLSAQTFTANYDDLIASSAAADYPFGDGKVLLLKPNGMGTNSNAANFRNDDNSAIGSTSWARLDEIPMANSSDFIMQTTASSTSYIELTFEDTTERCVRAVQGDDMYNNQTTTLVDDGKTSIFDGSTERVVNTGGRTSSSAGETVEVAVVAPLAAAWTPAELNGLVMRIGYSSDASPSPRWDAVAIEYEVPI